MDTRDARTQPTSTQFREKSRASSQFDHHTEGGHSIPVRRTLGDVLHEQLKKDADCESAEDSDEDSDYEILAGLELDKPLASDSGDETGDETRRDNRGSPVERLTTPEPGREDLHIVFAKYQDDTLHGDEEIQTNSTGGLAAEIDAIAGSANSTVKPKPLYRWIHLSCERMEFDEFSRISCGLPNLSDTDKEHISWILRRAQEKAIELFVDRKGTKGRVAKPVIITRTTKRQMGTEVYTFMNFTFFRLQSSSELQASEENRLHHVRPLMQSRHPSVTKQRDLQQAVCQVPGTPRDTYFHVSSFWYLVISDKYVVTYSRGLDVKRLCGDLINVRFLPSRQMPSTKACALQMVFQGDLYLVPIEKCSTWFSLKQLFYWATFRFDDIAQIFWKGREIGPAKWPSVIEKARQRPQRVVTEWRRQLIKRAVLKADPGGLSGTNGLSEDPSEHQGSTGESTQSEGESKTGACKSLLRPSSPNTSRFQVAQIPHRSPYSTPISMESYLDVFHTLRWIAVQRSMTIQPNQHGFNDGGSPHISMDYTSPRKAYDQQTKEFLNDLSKMMGDIQEPQKRRLYTQCPLKTLEEVKKALSGNDRFESGEQEVVRMKRILLSAAISAFQFFLPLDQHGPICSKYWGSLHRSITSAVQTDMTEMHKVKALRTVEKLARVAEIAMRTQHQLSHGKGPNPNELKLPVHFVRAWYYLLSCMLNMTWTPKANRQAWKYVQKFENELNAGYDIIFGKDEGRRLLGFRAVMPAELPAFLIQRLVEGIDGSKPSTEKACWDYFGQLDTQLTKDPLDPSYQASAALLLDEVEVLKHHTNEQLRVLSELSNLFPFQKHEINFYDRFQVRALRDVIGVVASKRDSLVDLQDKAGRLLSSSKENIERNKDHRDAAIYVFTIVTIIFLPISTVSSIFGMNTKDLRDMEKTQWLFWVTAIPVTIVTVIISLVGAGVIRFRKQKFTPLTWKRTGGQTTEDSTERRMTEDTNSIRSGSSYIAWG